MFYVGECKYSMIKDTHTKPMCTDNMEYFFDNMVMLKYLRLILKSANSNSNKPLCWTVYMCSAIP